MAANERNDYENVDESSSSLDGSTSWGDFCHASWYCEESCTSDYTDYHGAHAFVASDSDVTASTSTASSVADPVENPSKVQLTSSEILVQDETLQTVDKALTPGPSRPEESKAQSAKEFGPNKKEVPLKQELAGSPCSDKAVKITSPPPRLPCGTRTPVLSKDIPLCNTMTKPRQTAKFQPNRNVVKPKNSLGTHLSSATITGDPKDGMDGNKTTSMSNTQGGEDPTKRTSIVSVLTRMMLHKQKKPARPASQAHHHPASSSKSSSKDNNRDPMDWWGQYDITRKEHMPTNWAQQRGPTVSKNPLPTLNNHKTVARVPGNSTVPSSRVPVKIVSVPVNSDGGSTVDTACMLSQDGLSASTVEQQQGRAVTPFSCPLVNQRTVKCVRAFFRSPAQHHSYLFDHSTILGCERPQSLSTQTPILASSIGYYTE